MVYKAAKAKSHSAVDIGIGRSIRHGTRSIHHISDLEALPVDDRWPRFIVFALGNPHLLECTQGGDDRHLEPDGVLTITVEGANISGLDRTEGVAIVVDVHPVPLGVHVPGDDGALQAVKLGFALETAKLDAFPNV